MTQKVYIVAAKRTAIGSFLGSLSSVSAVELGAEAIKAALKQANVEPDWVDEVIAGNVLGAGQGQGVGRQASIHAGIPATVPAYTLNMICGSGMKTVLNGINAIKSGDANLVVAAGMESMSNAPFVMSGKSRQGNKLGDMAMVDSLLKDGLTDAFGDFHMGITAENVAKRYQISREEQDQFALTSQHRAQTAIEQQRFEDEIVPISIKTRKDVSEFAVDEHPRFDASLEALASLKPAFERSGSVTAGNASGINDGAVALILASEQAVEQYQLIPLVEVLATGQGGVEPDVMGLGPIPAVGQALERSGLTLGDIERLELNEAFAAQALGVIKGLAKQHQLSENWFADRTNVNGGAIALGHPIGASGGRILTSLIYELIRSKTQLGLASLCIGGGMGTAIIIRRV
ncbi:acetyl-CoA C-acetyltransferase [Vibrio ouci]|uniref:Acetyl-CoA C-acetyltransferase n=1 Tax=Vibrio ouci TaxID=2499078 RepID=A0A4Y8WCZ8_9VIBR|nr:acetyl-CoA C-acetyltransferase [Vibrio ouci]TFH90131.1 acetyl-CoA C-acetyltransferase [Vibrio ouci]